MPQAKHIFLDYFTVLLILFAHTCIAFDIENSYTNIDHIITKLNTNEKNYTDVDINVSTKEYVTRESAACTKACTTRKKWQVGRVSRKQYEIINMLWRKTNVFADEGDISQCSVTEQSDTQTKSILNLTPVQQRNLLRANIDIAPITHSSTKSFIEFYYLDEYMESSTVIPETIGKVKKKTSDKAPNRLGEIRNYVSRLPLLSFHINNGSVWKRMASSSQPVISFGNNQREPKREIIPNNTLLQILLAKNKDIQYVRLNTYSTKTTRTETSLSNDKVHFFEIYDSHTQVVRESTTKSINNSEIDGEKRLVLEQVDKDIGHGPNQIRYAKKHVKFKDMSQNFTQFVKSLIKLNKQVESKIKPVAVGNIKQDNFAVTPNWDDDIFNYTSIAQISVAWSKYPFAAVYVYERFQVHCDAAAISPYWLISSAACISRHREGTEGDRSAFVAYCGDNWWNPERIAYVKYTLVHPRYHPTDTTRKHLYNIGVVQVASSMSSSCPGWEPVSIISYQYVSEKKGSMGCAVGWGLNRYDTSYASRDLPKHHLSVYENFIYSDSCPGNSVYRKLKRLSESAVSNVYCLALPNYYGEDSDPVHGGMLLVEGKLIGLYLQEERRGWGDQSAQYTGVWRLVPWVNDLAKDPEDMEFSLKR